MTTFPSTPPGSPGSIVLVDDEVELVEAVSVMLKAEFGESRVKATSDPNEALTWLSNEKPSTLITDVRMPGLSGLELVARVQRMWGPTPTIIITAFPTEDVSVGARRGSFLYLPKPFAFRSLLDTIQKLEASPPPSFSGAIAVSTLADLIQLYAISGSTGMIQIRSEPHRGEIWFERGQVVHARTGNAQGFDAFCAILNWPKGSFSWKPRRAEAQTIEMSTSELLLEAYRIHDEQAHEASTQPRLPSSIPPVLPGVRLPSSPPSEGLGDVRRMLERFERIDGFIGAALIDSDSGLTLGVLGGDMDLDITIAAAGNTEVVRAKRKTMKDLGLEDEIEDMLITLGKQYHLIRPLRSRPGVFFYVAIDRTRANLALARMSLADAENGTIF